MVPGTTTRRVVRADGTTRKSEVAPDVVARGGGHLCPWEIYVFLGAEVKRCRMTTGFTKNGGFLLFSQAYNI